MVLFDTNVLIDYWRQPEKLLELKITPDKFALCGIVRTELLQGAKNDEVDKLLEFFQGFNNLVNDDCDWEGAGFLLQTLHSNGVQIPLADAFIAFTAMKYDIPLWTRDSHFKFVQGYYPELKLYEE
ncbi:MAG: PIN domain-containing protein [Treponema sp.]|nr:PIN domain-containing protein [Treponema sp.]